MSDRVTFLERDWTGEPTPVLDLLATVEGRRALVQKGFCLVVKEPFGTEHRIRLHKGKRRDRLLMSARPRGREDFGPWVDVPNKYLNNHYRDELWLIDARSKNEFSG